MPSPVPGVITGYFEADARRDADAVVALFAGDGEVVDEGRTYRGPAEIKAWREGPASRYQYQTELAGVSHAGPDTYLVTGTITGDFPAGMATLTWHFTICGDAIARLHISP